MIRAIIFDFFGVLSTEGFSLFCETYFPNDKDSRLKAIQLVSSHDVGRISKIEYVTGLSALAGVSTDIVEQHMGRNTPNRALLDFIQKDLKPHYTISILSNAGDDYIRKILDPKDVAMFDDIVLSYEVGLVKPQPEIYRLASKRLDLENQECLFVDDSQTHCQGAINIGMQAVWYRDFAQMKTELEKILVAAGSNN